MWRGKESCNRGPEYFAVLGGAMSIWLDDVNAKTAGGSRNGPDQEIAFEL